MSGKVNVKRMQSVWNAKQNKKLNKIFNDLRFQIGSFWNWFGQFTNYHFSFVFSSSFLFFELMRQLKTYEGCTTFDIFQKDLTICSNSSDATNHSFDINMSDVCWWIFLKFTPLPIRIIFPTKFMRNLHWKENRRQSILWCDAAMENDWR